MKSTPELLTAVLERVPEGMVHRSVLGTQLSNLQPGGQVAQLGDYFYDTARLNPAQAQQMRRWCKAVLPNMNKQGMFSDSAIAERKAQRIAQLHVWEDREVALRLLYQLDEADGYANSTELLESGEHDSVLQKLVEAHFLKQMQVMVYDPLRYSTKTAQVIYNHKFKHRELIEKITDFIKSKLGETAKRAELALTFESSNLDEVLTAGGFAQFDVPVKGQITERWVRLKEGDAALAVKIATEASKLTDESWRAALEAAGDVLRPDAKEGKTLRSQTIARSYAVSTAAKRLGVRQPTLETAVKNNAVAHFIDPEQHMRIPAAAVEEAIQDIERLEQIAAFEILKVRELAIVCDIGYSGMRRCLVKAKVNTTHTRWGDVRGKWELPDTLHEFRLQLKERRQEWLAQREAERLEQERLAQAQHEYERQERENERRRRDVLRARLVAAFPAWRHEGRGEQHITLHVGPPNSGKTYHALQALSQAGSGWYLAPLRLLAFEIFDRLNEQGVPCNLLTGEERIEMPGATITAATVEMFNPKMSGECVVIDESQMLADPDRGWAWTRAMMGAEAPHIRVIAPLTAHDLVERLAAAAAIPIHVQEHQRLAPIQVADSPWTLHKLPPRTILVAFSRRMVLFLKTELEKVRRRVVVIYGSLPPEVRRRQADRFANGEAEICIATDAVGMGLNLPADYVCFYEVEKYDGQRVRMLLPGEVQQIGGRAGRFGLSRAGEVGALNKQNLKLVRTLFNAEPDALTYARVAPTVEDLEMLPGSLWQKLTQWSALQSIPDALREIIKTANLTERIELSKLLTDWEVNDLGLEAAIRLTNAPTREGNRTYWRNCATAIIRSDSMPMPPMPPERIEDGVTLEATEHAIGCADIYLWLAQRREFQAFGSSEDDVRRLRTEWSFGIDRALQHKLDTRRKCVRCGQPLPHYHRYRMCDNCYYNGRFALEDDYF